VASFKCITYRYFPPREVKLTKSIKKGFVLDTPRTTLTVINEKSMKLKDIKIILVYKSGEILNLGKKFTTYLQT
jgi:hypothetical protein